MDLNGRAEALVNPASTNARACETCHHPTVLSHHVTPLAPYTQRGRRGGLRASPQESLPPEHHGAAIQHDAIPHKRSGWQPESTATHNTEQCL